MKLGPVLAGLAFLSLGYRSCAAQSALGAPGCLSFEPHTVALRGRLTIERKYGPPNYGEDSATDKKVQLPILVLDQPVEVCGDSTSQLNSASVHNVKEIQLFLPGRTHAYDRLINQSVIVTGTLSAANASGEYTPVVLTATDAKVVALPPHRGNSAISSQPLVHQPPYGFIVLGPRSSAAFQLRAGDTLPEIHAEQPPSRVSEAASKAATGHRFNPRSSRYFDAATAYVVIYRSI
jgi:hypothetical protein